MTIPCEPVPTVTTPIALGERIQVLDILRGFSLLGMILVHFHQKIEIDVAGPEGMIGWFTWLALEQKAWGTFAFLFGVGFAVLLRSFEAKEIPVVRYYLRRLLGLAVFGIIAEACFGFSILLEYALWGVSLLFIRRWPTRALLIVALLAVAFGPLLAFGRAAYQSHAPAAQAAEIEDSQADAYMTLLSAEAGSEYRTLVGARLHDMRVRYSHWQTYQPGSSFALFILGLLAVRHGVFHEPLRHIRLIVGWMAFGFLSWALWWLVWLYDPPVPWPDAEWAVHSALGLLQDQWLCFTYIGALLLLTTWRPIWLKRLAFVGVTGRMALTNYMLQIAVLDFLGSGYGIGLRARPLVSLLGTALLYGALVVFSRWWLSRYRLGPAEWLWRSFTYLLWQPLRRSPS